MLSGYVLALGTVVLWASLPLFLKKLLEVLPASTIVGFRFGFAAVLIGLWLGLKSPSRRSSSIAIPPFGKKNALILVAAGLSIAANYYYYQVALRNIQPSTGQVLIQLTPFLIAALAFFLLKERLTLPQFIGFVLLGLGLWVFFSHYSIDWNRGCVDMMLAALFLAFFTIAQKHLLLLLPSLRVLFWVFSVAFVVFAPLVDWSLLLLQSSFSWWLLIFASLNTVAAYGFLSESLRRLPASSVGALIALTPLGTLLAEHIFAAWYPKASASMGILPVAQNQVVGALLVIAGSWMGARKNRREDKTIGTVES